jgi:adenosylhomocysteine nucleosidase
VVLLPDGRSLASDPAWRQRAADRLPEALSLAIAGSDRALVGVADKAALRCASGAAAVDMESHAVAQEAVAAGLPFLVIRAIADPAGRALPAAALAGLSPDGSARPWAVLLSLLGRPDQLVGLVRLIGDSAAGFAALGRVGSRLGPRLAFA